MKWIELKEFLNSIQDVELLENKVYAYDQTKGEFYEADLIEFLSDDDIIDVSSLFLQFESEN